MTAASSAPHRDGGQAEPSAEVGQVPPGSASEGRGPATAATVRLATAARVVDISQATAIALAEHGEYPCTAIRASDGYHVPFAALLRVLRSASGRRAQPSERPGRE